MDTRLGSAARSTSAYAIIVTAHGAMSPGWRSTFPDGHRCGNGAALRATFDDYFEAVDYREIEIVAGDIANLDFASST